MRDRDKVALIACGLAIAFAGLALGGVLRWSAVIIALLGVIAAGAYVTSRRTSSSRSPVSVMLGLAIALTAIQLLPLPLSIARFISPAKAELLVDNAAAWGDPAPSLAMSSFDPPATLVELAKFLGYFAFAYAASRLAANRRTRVRFAQVVAGGGSLVAVIAMAHQLVGAKSLYGFITPPVTETVLGPLFNVNHLASLLAMIVPLSLGLAVWSVGWQRLLWLGSSLLCAAVALLTSSRGGAVGLVAGVVIATVVLIAQRRASATRGEAKAGVGIVLPAILIGACTVLLLGRVTATEVAGELSTTRLDELSQPRSKFQVWKSSTGMLAENRWIGVGKGAFEPAFMKWSEVGDITYSHAENSYLQAALDWGVPGASALIIAGAVLLFAALKRWRHGPIEAGALGAMAAIAIHELADFSLEVPVVALVAISAVVILVPARVGADADGAGHAVAVARSTKIGRGVLVGFAVLIIGLAASPLGRSAHAENNDSAITDLTARVAMSRLASSRHPADSIILGRAAQTMLQVGDARAVAIISRALDLNPTHSGMHRLAAAMLTHSQHPSQAAVELSLALSFARTNEIPPILDDVIATFADPDDAASAMPIDPRFAPRIARGLEAKGQSAISLAYGQRIARLNPRSPIAQLALARAAITSRRPELAMPAARAADDLQPSTATAVAVAQARAEAGDFTSAIAGLHAALQSGLASTTPQKVQLLTTLADVLIARGDLLGATAALDDLEPLLTDSTSRMGLHHRRAEIAERAGNHNQAEWERSQVRALGAPPVPGNAPHQ